MECGAAFGEMLDLVHNVRLVDPWLQKDGIREKKGVNGYIRNHLLDVLVPPKKCCNIFLFYLTS